MLFHHFHCISSKCILHLLHGTAYYCIYTHSCMMHSDIDAFAYIHTHVQCCIWYKMHSCAFECILFWLHFLSCCILVHSLHKMHSCAFFVCCILTCRILTHFNTFSAWCILNVLHSICDAFRCIIMYSSALTVGGKMPDFDERSYSLHDA
jgi:hypothetical protein